MLRKISEVVEQMIALVPSTEEQFINDLTHMKVTAAFIPPQASMKPYWDQLGRIMENRIPQRPTEEWQYQVISIFMSKPVDVIRSAFQGVQLAR